jgi:hypothetical protein
VISKKRPQLRVGPDVAEIVRLSRKLHGTVLAADDYTFRSLAEHVDEVRQLLRAHDRHWKSETLDIIIHALTLLKRHGAREDEIAGLFRKRAGRFKKKITDALSEQA